MAALFLKSPVLSGLLLDQTAILSDGLSDTVSGHSNKPFFVEVLQLAHSE